MNQDNSTLSAWRPASDPPAKPEWVIIFAPTTNSAAITGIFNGNGWTDDMGEEIVVTHWQPFPAPPTELREGMKEDKSLPIHTPETDAAFDMMAEMRKAQEFVEASSLWRRFIDGTPLSNDVSCWIANAVVEKADFARSLERRLAVAVEALKKIAPKPGDELENWDEDCAKQALAQISNMKGTM